ncbi:MAG: hypothetical protein AAGC57_17450 [Pseudomonadota bacterium]
MKSYPAETTEAFCDGHVSAFACFGGVPLSILYDNTVFAVALRHCARTNGGQWLSLGDGTRKRTRIFSELQSPSLFQDRFGSPGKGNDKGKVEGVIGFGPYGRLLAIACRVAGGISWCPTQQICAADHLPGNGCLGSRASRRRTRG